MNDLKPAQLAPLVLAYIGDGVYELFVRNKIVKEHPDMPPHKLHILSSSHVKAHSQSVSMAAIEPILTEDELKIYKRGRNAKSGTVPKNADVTDYRRSSGFEALIGYLYLTNRTERLSELMELAYINSHNEN